MRNISSKTDNVGDVLPASDFNINHRIELQSIVTDAGFSLDPEGGPDTDTDMLGKSLTVYANASQYYADTGAVDAYEIDRVGNLQPLEQLLDGTIVYFKAANTNTGASTLDVDGIGAKDLVSNNGAALVGGEIETDQYVTARYNSATDDFEIISSANLISWKNYGYDFIPVTSGLGALGSATNLVEALYLGDSNYIYVGANQDLEIFHNGTISQINNNTGDLWISNSSASNITFITNSTIRWVIDSGGDLLPNASNTYDIGSTGNEVADIYIGDNHSLYLGSDQDALVRHSGSQLDIATSTGPMILTVSSADSLYFTTNGTLRWRIDSSGYLIPQAAGTYQIGSSTNYTYYVWSQQLASPSTLRLVAGAGSDIQFAPNNSNQWSMNGSAFYPVLDNTEDIGLSSSCVKTIYYYTLSACSDERLKENFSDVPGLDFISQINPIAFNFIGDETKKDKKRYGVSAQQVAAINDNFGGITYDYESDRYGMDYTQLIAPIIKSIQELNDKIESLIGTL